MDKIKLSFGDEDEYDYDEDYDEDYYDDDDGGKQNGKITTPKQDGGVMKNTIWIVDDSEDIAEMKVEIIQKLRPKATVRVFQDLQSVVNTEGKCDLLFCDISAISPLSYLSPLAFTTITHLFTRRPHLPFIVSTVLDNSFAKEIIHRLKEIGFDSTVDYVNVGQNMEIDIEFVLNQYLPHKKQRKKNA